MTANQKTNAKWDRVVSTADLLGEEAPAWLISEVLTERQLGVLSGPSKAHKSDVAIDMTFALATGTPFLGRFQTPSPKRVLFASDLSSQTGVGCKVKAIDRNGGCGQDAVEWRFDTSFLDTAEGVDRLRLDLRRHGTDVLIIDPLFKLLLAPGNGDAARNLFQIGPIIGRLTDMCVSEGVTPILVHHDSKGGGKSKGSADRPALTDLAYAGVIECARQWYNSPGRTPISRRVPTSGCACT